MRLLLALVVLLLLPAAAGATVCKLTPPPPKLSKQERMLRETIAARRDLGFRHDRAFVRRVNADSAARRRAVEGYFPMTRREKAYVDARDTLTIGPAYRRFFAYERRHRHVFGVVSIEDDWPEGAYLQVRVTRDLARHRAALRRFGVRFRIERVRWSERELRRLQDRIDDKALEAEGIHFVSSGIGAGERLRLDVATTRADVHEVVRRLYGPAVRVLVVGPTPTFESCSRPERYEVAADGRTLTVHWTDSGSITPRRIEVIETPTEVFLGAVVETGYFQTGDAVQYEFSVTLAEPLGDRAVRTIERGYAVRRGPPARG